MKVQASQLKLLQSQAFFGGITDDVVTLLLDSSSTVEVSAGDYFFRQGDAAKAMYVLEEGQVAILKEWKGKEYLLRELRPGDCFGEMALMDFQARSASVYAEEDSLAIMITPATLLRVSQKDPGQFAMIEMNMGREVCRRLRELEEHLFEERVLKEVSPETDLQPD